MNRLFPALRGAISRSWALFVPGCLLLAAATGVATAQGSVQPQPPQVVVRRGPATTGQGADTLVQCVPVNAPARRAVVAKPRVRRRPRAAAMRIVKPVRKPVHTPVRKPAVAAAPVRKRPIVRRVRHVTPARAAPTRRALPSLVMCRPIHPVPAMQMGPLPETLVPIPQVASVTPAAPLPVAPAAPEAPPAFVTASAPHSGFLPLALIPAFFIPFIHSGRPHNPAESPIDTTAQPLPPGSPPPGSPPPGSPPPGSPPPGSPPPGSPPPGSPPPGSPPPGLPPGPPPPPLTTPEPSSVALLGTGLIALGGVGGVRRRRQRHTS